MELPRATTGIRVLLLRWKIYLDINDHVLRESSQSTSLQLPNATLPCSECGIAKAARRTLNNFIEVSKSEHVFHESFADKGKNHVQTRRRIGML